MALNLPDILKHSNSNYALVDSDSIRGGTKSAVANLTALYQLSASYAQAGVSGTLKNYATRVWVTSENQYYTLIDETNAGKAIGWMIDNQYVNTTFFKVSGDTATGNSVFTKDLAVTGMLSSASYADFSTLSAKNVLSNFIGTNLFKTVSANEISTNVALGSATVHGIFYGDGRRLLGSAFDQDVVNSWVRSNSSVATGYNTLSSNTIYSDFVGTTLFKAQSAVTVSTNTAAGSATFHGIYYGNGWELEGVDKTQPVINSWVRSNSSIATGYNTLSSKTVYGDFFGTTLFKSQSAVTISTNTAAGSSTFHGVYYGNGWELEGVDKTQPVINSWVRSNSSVATGYNTLSSKTVYGDFFGTTLFKSQSAVTISTNTAAGSSTFHGVYYGNGWELEGVDKTQPVINSWVRSNSSIATGYNTLSSKTVYGDFFGTTLFKTVSAAEITTNVALGSATVHGIFYGDGRRLLGSAFDQDVVNSWVRSNSSVATGYSTLSSNTIYGDFVGTPLFKTVSAAEITTNVALGSATVHGIFYGDGRRLLGSAFDQDVVNSWVRSNSSVSTGYNTLSSKTIYGDFFGTTLFKTVSVAEITTNVALGSATHHGIFYGDGRRLLGSAFDQDIVNSWVRSNSSISTGYNTLSSNTIYSDFFGTTLFKTVSANEISTNVALGSATHHGIFYGDGRRLLGSAFDQDVVNSWVRSNSSISTGYNTLSSNTIYGDFVGTQLFKTDNSTEISTNVALGSATVHGIFYGDGRRLLGSAFDQDVVNSWVRSNSSISTGYDTLSTDTIYGDFFGTTLFKTESAAAISTNTALGSATMHGVFYGDGTFLDKVTVGNRRFEYITPSGPYPAYSYSGTTRSIYTTTSDPYWKIVRVEYDADGTVLGLSSTTGATWISRASKIYYPF